VRAKDCRGAGGAASSAHKLGMVVTGLEIESGTVSLHNGFSFQLFGTMATAIFLV
jgi:hypothetical protein